MSRARHKLTTLTRPQVLVLAGVAVLLVFLFGSYLWAQQGQQAAQEQTGVVTGQRDAERSAKDATAAQAKSLAEQIKAACAAGDLVGPVCVQAEQVATTPVPPVPGPTGVAGVDGRGVSDVTINAAGHLVVVYTDGATEDVGPVVGSAGADGADGAPGRGIADVEITGGRLVVAFTNGATQDLGPVVGEDGTPGQDGSDGADGRGIASVDQRDGRLIVTYTDGTTQDAGPLPAGPQGEEGPMGPAGECPAGTSLQPVEFASGESGLGCVDDEQAPDDEEPPTTTEPAAPTTGP